MRLGIAEDVNVYSYSSCQQAVQMPAGIAQADLTFYYYPLMDPTGDDLIYFCVLEASNDIVLQCHIWTELESGWHRGAFNMLAYAGLHIKVHFGVRNDGVGRRSALWLDDVELWVR